jgi:release factor glutamine methyltransferase
VREAIDQAARELGAVARVTARRDAELLLLHIMGLSRTDVIAYPGRELSAEQALRYEQALARRKRSEPVQYIIGEREFYGLRFTVTPDVLIPRPETEHLVEAALDRIPANVPVDIADVGTGSGAIAVALALLRPLAAVRAIDISAAALRVAKSNASAHGVADRIEFLEGDLLAGFDGGSLDMVVSNPPYIANGERETLAAEVREYEPASALFAGPTGLEIYERLIPQAMRALRPGGWLLMEIGSGQKLQLQLLLKQWPTAGFVADLQAIPRVVIARRA